MLKSIVTLACFSVLVPLGIGIKRFRTLSGDLKALTLFLIFSALIDFISYYLWLEHRNNLPLLHILTPVEFACFSYIYAKHIKTIITGEVILIFAVLVVLFSLINSFYIQSFTEFNSYAKGIEYIFILFYAIVFIYHFYTTDSVTPLSRVPMFWVNTAILLYHTTSFFVFLLSNNMLLHLSRETVHMFWSFHGLVLIIYYILFSVALWIHPQQP